MEWKSTMLFSPHCTGCLHSYFHVIKSWKYNCKNMNTEHSSAEILWDFLANSRGSNNASITTEILAN